MFTKCKFMFSDSEEIYEGCSDGTAWNGWANIFMSKEQVKDFLDCLPYDYKFYNKGEIIPSIVIYGLGNDGQENVESSPIWTGEEFIEAYALNGYEFMIVGDDNE